MVLTKRMGEYLLPIFALELHFISDTARWIKYILLVLSNNYILPHLEGQNPFIRIVKYLTLLNNEPIFVSIYLQGIYRLQQLCQNVNLLPFLQLWKHLFVTFSLLFVRMHRVWEASQMEHLRDSVGFFLKTKRERLTWNNPRALLTTKHSTLPSGLQLQENCPLDCGSCNSVNYTGP